MTKRPACCLGCGTETYEIRERQEPSGTVLADVLRVGPMLEHGTQVELLLSDGSCAHLDFCVECADRFGPADYQAAWDAVLDATALSLASRRPNEQRRGLLGMMRVWPLAVLRWRRQDPATGDLVLDRRGPPGLVTVPAPRPSP